MFGQYIGLLLNLDGVNCNTFVEFAAARYHTAGTANQIQPWFGRVGRNHQRRHIDIIRINYGCF